MSERRRNRSLLAASLAAVLLLPATARGAGEYDVRIVFTGIMSVVPGKESATVIIPNVPPGKYGDHGHDVDAHVAYILASETAMPPRDKWNADDDFDAAAHEGKTYHYLELNGDQIVLDDENEVPLLNKPLTYSTVAPAANDVCPNANTHTSLYWLPSQKRVMGAEQQPDAARFDPRPKKADVLARARLRYGALNAHVVKPGSVWEFRTPVNAGPHPDTEPRHKQALAQEVHWTFKAAGEPFVLNLISFEGATRRVAFYPDDDKKLVIVVGHTTHADTGPIAQPKRSERDDHYSLHHTSIAGNPDGKGRIPHRLEIECEDSFVDYVFDPILKSAAANTAAAAAKEHNAHAASLGQPAPSGLNCPPNTWP